MDGFVSKIPKISRSPHLTRRDKKQGNDISASPKPNVEVSRDSVLNASAKIQQEVQRNSYLSKSNAPNDSLIDRISLHSLMQNNSERSSSQQFDQTHDSQLQFLRKAHEQARQSIQKGNSSLQNSKCATEIFIKQLNHNSSSGQTLQTLQQTSEICTQTKVTFDWIQLDNLGQLYKLIRDQKSEIATLKKQNQEFKAQIYVLKRMIKEKTVDLSKKFVDLKNEQEMLLKLAIQNEQKKYLEKTTHIEDKLKELMSNNESVMRYQDDVKSKHLQESQTSEKAFSWMAKSPIPKRDNSNSVYGNNTDGVKSRNEIQMKQTISLPNDIIKRNQQRNYSLKKLSLSPCRKNGMPPSPKYLYNNSNAKLTYADIANAANRQKPSKQTTSNSSNYNQFNGSQQSNFSRQSADFGDRVTEVTQNYGIQYQ